MPLDGSELAEVVLPHVRTMVRPGETHVHVLSVLTVGLSDRTVALMTTYPPGLRLSTTAMAQARLDLQRYLQRIAARVREWGATAAYEVREGNPAEEILCCAAEIEADLIVMSTHGLSGLSRWVYGSVTAKVLRQAPCPVLLVRPAP